CTSMSPTLTEPPEVALTLTAPPVPPFAPGAPAALTALPPAARRLPTWMGTLLAPLREIATLPPLLPPSKDEMHPSPQVSMKMVVPLEPRTSMLPPTVIGPLPPLSCTVPPELTGVSA